MIQGHLNQQRANLHSTKPKPSSPSPFTANSISNSADISSSANSDTVPSVDDLIEDFVPSIPSPPAARTHNIYA